MSPIIAESLELENNDSLSIQRVRNVPRIEAVSLRCLKPSDYELMHLEQDFFENHILIQGALVVRDQILPVWLRRQTEPVELLPVKMVPRVQFGILTRETEVEIQPDIRTDQAREPENRERLENGVQNDGAGPSRGPEITEDARERRHGNSALQNDAPAVAEQNGGGREPQQTPGFPVERGPIAGAVSGPSWQSRREWRCLRVQRLPPEVADLLRVPVQFDVRCNPEMAFLQPPSETKSLIFNRWFSEDCKILTSVNTVLFLPPATAEELSLKAGDFAVVTGAKPSRNEFPKHTAVLKVVLTEAVVKRHCMMHPDVLSQLAVRCCQRVFVCEAIHNPMDLSQLSSLTARPVTIWKTDPNDFAADEKTPEKAEPKPQKAVQYLRDLLFGKFDLQVFQNPEEIAVSRMQESQVRKTVEKALDYCNYVLPFSAERVVDRLGLSLVGTTSLQETRAQLFLKALFLGWIEAQTKGTHGCHQSALAGGSDPEHVDELLLTPENFMHFTITSPAGASVDLKMRLDLPIGTASVDGYVAAKCSLWCILKGCECQVTLADTHAIRVDSFLGAAESFLAGEVPPWLLSLRETCVQYVRHALIKTDDNDNGLGLTVGVIVAGGPDSGKSSFASSICQCLANDPNILADVCYVPCRSFWPSMKDSFDQFSKVKRRLYSMMEQVLGRDPCIVVLDDVDCWCASEEDSHLNASSSVRERAIKMVRQLIQAVRAEGHAACFLATCTDFKNMDGALCENGFLDYQLRLPDLTSAVRAEMMMYLFHKSGAELDLDALQGMCEWDAGFEYADLERLVSRSVYCQQHSSTVEGSLITKRHIQAALKDFKPAAQWKATRAKDEGGSSDGLGDVGGMDRVKAILRDCVELPLRFPDLMTQCPLRLMSNVLLYGPPGCGKTFVVNALKTSLSIRLVRVKGPELLNKYVGQSEAAVRATFKAAAEAAPCILFFDEFEALGGQRGHQHSHASDRVVNQLLTEMDGVEGLCGVCVIAATSRPDLIDKALLRPGRLDQHVFCGWPNKAERLEILKAVTNKQDMADGIDLGQIADGTAGYSGADLAAIMSEAHLHAVAEYVKAHPDPQSAPDPVAISATDVDYVLQQSRPSCSDRDRHFLEAVYWKFSDGKVCHSHGLFLSEERRLTFA